MGNLIKTWRAAFSEGSPPASYLDKASSHDASHDAAMDAAKDGRGGGGGIAAGSTTPPDFPFGIVSLAGGTSEGFSANMGAFRLAQAGGTGLLPTKAWPNTFVAQVRRTGRTALSRSLSPGIQTGGRGMALLRALPDRATAAPVPLTAIPQPSVPPAPVPRGGGVGVGA